MSAWFAVIAGVLGFTVGSFLNVCIDRLPRHESIVTGRSHCDSCGRQLAVQDLVPVLSYAILGGRCRACGASIPRRIVAVEAATGLTFAGLSLWYGATLTFALLAVYAAVLTVVFVIDLEHGLILNAVVVPALVLALVAAATLAPAWLGDLFPHRVLSAAAGAATGFALLFLVALLARGGMGWGDVKFAAFMGAATGFPLVFVALFCGIIIGGAAGAVLLATRKKGRKQAIPFGPFLALGTMATLLWGPQMLAWYVGLM